MTLHFSSANITNLIIAVTGLVAAITGIITALHSSGKANVANVKAEAAQTLASDAHTAATAAIVNSTTNNGATNDVPGNGHTATNQAVHSASGQQ